MGSREQVDNAWPSFIGRREAEVTETDLFAALALLLAGVAIGILVMICLGIRRADQPGGLPAHTNDPAARAPGG